MKKNLCLLLSALLILASNPIYTSAAVQSNQNMREISNSTVIYEDNDIIIECTLTITQSSFHNIQPFSSTQSKTASKKHTIKHKDNTVIGTYTLTGTFSYNGKTSSCTSASCSTSIKNNNWSFTSKIANKSGSKATGSYTTKHSSKNYTVSNSLSITCSKNGTIS